jgi:short-subunit dehydrogenase
MHVVVTGASSGIGAALAREFGKDASSSLTLLARRKAAMEELAGALPAKCNVIAHDLSDETRATEWIAEAEERSGPIDVMINNAGVENTGYVHESDTAAGLALLSTNLMSPILISRTLVPKMIVRQSGTIVNVASAAAFAAIPLQAWYGASKAGLAMFSEVLRAEVRRFGVHVVTVYPGPIKTPMADAAYGALGGRKGMVGLAPEGSSERLARLVRRAVDRKRKRVVYPAFYNIPRLVPWLARIVSDGLPVRAHARLPE